MSATDAEKKAFLREKLARNEALALQDPAAFLAQRRSAVPSTRAEQGLAVRALFDAQRDRHGGR